MITLPSGKQEENRIVAVSDVWMRSNAVLEA
jgi:hypothetical protein